MLYATFHCWFMMAFTPSDCRDLLMCWRCMRHTEDAVVAAYPLSVLLQLCEVILTVLLMIRLMF